MIPHSARSSLAGCLLPMLFAAVFGCAGKPSAVEEPPPARVKIETASAINLGEWTEILGTTQPLPDRLARVTALTEGRVVSVLGDGKKNRVAEGDTVQAGQVIVQLEDSVVKAKREKTAASMPELDEAMKQAQIAIKLAEVDVKRVSVGTLSNIVSPIEQEKFRLALLDAQSKLNGVVARKASLEAELKALDAEIEHYTLRAPIAGQLGLMQVQMGQTIPPGTTVVEIIDRKEIDVFCFVSPHIAARLEQGQAARRQGETETAGKVVYLGVQANPDTGNVAVKVRFPNPKFKMRANSLVRVQVLTKAEDERYVIPEAALLEDQDPPTVVTAVEVTQKDKDGKEEKVLKARRLKAIIGIRDRDLHFVEILRLEPFEKGEPVQVREAQFVTKGANGLRDDDVLKPEEEEPADEKK